MLRLLPTKEQERLRREYLLRFSVVACVVLSAVLLLWMFSMTPTAMLLHGEKRAVIESLRVAEDETLNKENKMLKEQLQSLSHRITLLDQERIQFSPYIRAVTTVQTRSINIQSISFEVLHGDASKPSQVKIVLQGLAQSRGALAGFKDQLDATGEFVSVELPLASFARDTDVPFTITLHATVENQT